MYPPRRKICVSLYIRHVAVGCHHHQTQRCMQRSLAAWRAPTDQVKLAQHPPAATRMQDIILFPVQHETSDALRRGELRPCSDTNISADPRHKAGMLCKPALFLGKGLAVGLNNKVVGMQQMRLLAGGGRTKTARPTATERTACLDEARSSALSISTSRSSRKTVACVQQPSTSSQPLLSRAESDKVHDMFARKIGTLRGFCATWPASGSSAVSTASWLCPKTGLTTPRAAPAATTPVRSMLSFDIVACM